MDKTFNIAPASSAPLITIAVIGIILVLILGMLFFAGYSSRNMKFVVSDRGLLIKGGIYGRFIPKEEIAVENVKIIDLNISPEYKPRIRTNGIGLPGYSEGWFRLKNNEKALLFVTSRSSIVYLPTKRNYSVMLSTGNPEEFRQSTEQWE